jgi:hypothetical protein
VTGKTASSAAENGSMPNRKHEILFERRENFSMLARYLFHLFDYG